MTFRERLFIEASLEVLSPLHVGTGGFGPVAGVVDDEGGHPDVALICRAADGSPYVAGTTIKGVIASLAPDPESAACRALFGEIKHEGGGRAAMLTAYGARLTAKGDSASLPLGGERPGLFVAARTAIDGGTGAVAEGKLFYQEMVAPGARFGLRLRLAGDNEAARDLLFRLLARAAGTNGIAFGKGQSDGQGRMRLLPETLGVTRESIGEDGSLDSKPQKDFDLAAFRPDEAATRRLRLTCADPFIVNDWSHVRPEGDVDAPHARAQRRAGGAPELPGTSLMGALRARADWLAKLKRFDRDCVGTLFGTTGRRASLQLNRLVSGDAAGSCTMTSVKIDRFSGAPVDNALFSTELFHGVEFLAELSLDRRARPEDREALQVLLNDLEEDGLRLGAGSGKGFGWFEVEVSDAAQ